MIDWRNAPGRVVPDPRLGHRNGRNYPGGDIYDKYWNIRWLGTDNLGFVYNHGALRDFNLSDHSYLRIFLLGESIAMGLGVELNSYTIASNLERVLRETYNHARVVNCAVGSYMSWQQMSFLSLELIGYEPDFVVILDGLNDLVHSTRSEEWIPNTHSSMTRILRGMQLEFHPSVLKLAKHTVMKNPVMAKAGKFVHRTQKRLKSSGEVISTPSQRTDATIKHEAIDWYVRNMKSTIGIAASNGAKVIYLFEPQLAWGTRRLTEDEKGILVKFNTVDPLTVDLAPEWYSQARERFLQVAGEIHNGKDIWIEDASNWLDGVEETVYHDWCHYNHTGQRIIAERIGRIILRMQATGRDGVDPADITRCINESCDSS